VDLSKFDVVKVANAGSKMPVKHPLSGEPLMDDGSPVTITLLGSDSDEYMKLNRKQRNERMGLRLQGDTIKTAKVEDLERDTLETAVICTTAWEGFDENGVIFSFTAENARALYTRLPWVLEQVISFIRNRANFLKN
jgi:hypothetical protein